MLAQHNTKQNKQQSNSQGQTVLLFIIYNINLLRKLFDCIINHHGSLIKPIQSSFQKNINIRLVNWCSGDFWRSVNRQNRSYNLRESE